MLQNQQEIKALQIKNIVPEFLPHLKNDKPFLKEIAIDTINLEENIRSEYPAKKYENLKLSIKNHGLLQPIIVSQNENSYFLKAGYHRLKACRELHNENNEKFETISCIVTNVDFGVTEKIIENIHRAGFSDAELVKNLPKLKARGLSNDEIGEILGLNKKTIDNLLSYIKEINNTPELKAIIQNGVTTVEKIYETRNIKNKDARLSLLQNSGSMTRDDLRKRVKELVKGEIPENNFPAGGKNSANNIFIGYGTEIRELDLPYSDLQIEDAIKILDEIETFYYSKWLVKKEEKSPIKLQPQNSQTDILEKSKNLFGNIKDRFMGDKTV
jgi:ParB family chromosome partitioning protein